MVDGVVGWEWVTMQNLTEDHVGLEFEDLGFVILAV